MPNHMNKLFGVLVLGGALMAQADENNIDLQDLLQIKNHCQVEVVQKLYDDGGNVKQTKVTCVDNKNDDETLEIVNEAKDQSCLTPFCGCWLG